MTRIINFFGAPGSGKTTAAAEAFVHAKKKGYSAHLVLEYVTELILQGDMEAVHNQKMLFEEQLRRINIAYTKTDYIMVDSPLLLGIVYNRYWKAVPDPAFEKQIIDAHNSFNQINVLLKCDPKYYSSKGRVTSQQDSFAIEQLITTVLQETHSPYIEINGVDELENCIDNIIEKGVKK